MRLFDFTTYGPAELAQVRQALQSLVTSPGWSVFARFLENRQQEIGNKALDDDTRTKDYWRGFRDGCRVIEGVEELLSRIGDELEARDDNYESQENFMRQHLGASGADPEDDLS